MRDPVEGERWRCSCKTEIAYATWKSSKEHRRHTEMMRALWRETHS